MKKRPSMIEDLINFSEEDLRSAKVLFEEDIYNQACFHSQQCVEKLLKASLLSHSVHFPKIHDLNELTQKCIQAGEFSLMQFREKISILGLYYTSTRYPDAMIGSLPDRLPNKKDAEEALSTAQEIYKHLTRVLSISKNP